MKVILKLSVPIDADWLGRQELIQSRPGAEILGELVTHAGDRLVDELAHLDGVEKPGLMVTVANCYSDNGETFPLGTLPSTAAAFSKRTFEYSRAARGNEAGHPPPYPVCDLARVAVHLPPRGFARLNSISKVSVGRGLEFYKS